MESLTKDKPDVAEISNFEEELFHWICDYCYPKDYDGPSIFSLCGTDVTGDEYVEGLVADCVVCLDMEYCPRCELRRDEEYDG